MNAIIDLHLRAAVLSEELTLGGGANSTAVPELCLHALRAATIRRRFLRASSNLPLGEWIGRRTRETLASSKEPLGVHDPTSIQPNE